MSMETLADIQAGAEKHNAAQGIGRAMETSMKQEPRSVCDLIEKWARKQPDHTTVVSESGRKVTYRELDHAASRIARLLLQKQVQPGDLIPVLATRSLETIASFVGILKAGACYEPIDIEAWSEERIQSTLKRVSAHVVVNLGTSTHPNYDILTCQEVEAAFGSTDEQESERQLP